MNNKKKYEEQLKKVNDILDTFRMDMYFPMHSNLDRANSAVIASIEVLYWLMREEVKE